jgi:hypothetical protein
LTLYKFLYHGIYPPLLQLVINIYNFKTLNSILKLTGVLSFKAGDDYSGQPHPGVVEPGAPLLGAGAWKPAATTWLSRPPGGGSGNTRDVYYRTYIFSQPQHTPTR